MVIIMRKDNPSFRDDIVIDVIKARSIASGCYHVVIGNDPDYMNGERRRYIKTTYHGHDVAERFIIDMMRSCIHYVVTRGLLTREQLMTEIRRHN
jgi:hypothetical protein